MATTIAFPSDAVTNGATEIQATVFNAVAADYSQISWNAAQNIMRQVPYKVPEFPRTTNEDPTWSFIIRKDLASSSAPSRNLIGVHVVDASQNMNVFSGALGSQISVPIRAKVVSIYNWVRHTITLTDGTAITAIRPYSVSIPIFVDPETGNMLDADETYNAVIESLGFLFLQVAANSPTRAPLYATVSGLYPLT